MGEMQKKTWSYFAFGAVILLSVVGSMLHSNDIQEFQVVQSPTGSIDII